MKGRSFIRCCILHGQPNSGNIFRHSPCQHEQRALARHKDISMTMKHYVRAKEEAKRRAIEGVSLGRIIGEG